MSALMSTIIVWSLTCILSPKILPHCFHLVNYPLTTLYQAHSILTLEEADRTKMESTGSHATKHTFGNVLQKIPASVATAAPTVVLAHMKTKAKEGDVVTAVDLMVRSYLAASGVPNL